jgi:MFS family permease
MKSSSDFIVEKPQSRWRWPILVLACLMMVGLYYSSDIPAALYTQLKDHMGNDDDFALNFGLLYTMYSTPNLVVPFFGGYLVDRYVLSLFFPLICLIVFLFLGWVTKPAC